MSSFLEDHDPWTEEGLAGYAEEVINAIYNLTEEDDLTDEQWTGVEAHLVKHFRLTIQARHERSLRDRVVTGGPVILEDEVARLIAEHAGNG